jgi:hypothetical protein
MSVPQQSIQPRRLAPDPGPAGPSPGRDVLSASLWDDIPEPWAWAQILGISLATDRVLWGPVLLPGMSRRRKPTP